MLLTTVRTARQRSTRRAGFTLLEVLVVVAILVILAGVSSFAIFRYMDDAKINKAKLDMQAIEKACKTYYANNNGVWPDNANLQQEIGPLLEGAAALQDPWGGMYSVQVIPMQDSAGNMTERIVVTSQGPKSKNQPLNWPDINNGK